MTKQEQQEIFDAIRERSERAGTFNRENGIRLTALSDGAAEGEVTLTERHRNPLGIVHGGVYCTLMDQVAGAAACTRGSRCRTVNCEVRFLDTPQGERLLGHAQAIRMGRSIVVMRSWVTDQRGETCAEGTYTFRMKEGFPAE